MSNKTGTFWMTIAILFLSACGDGDNKSPPGATQINGVLSAPSGQVAYFEEESFLYNTIDFVFSSAYAELLGLSPVPNAEVNLIEIDKNGRQIGEIHQTTITDNEGEFDFILPEGLQMSATLVVQVQGENGQTLRAFVVSTNIVITPLSELIVQEVLASDIDIELVTLPQLEIITNTLNGLEMNSASNIEETLTQLTTEQKGVIDNLLETVVVYQANELLNGETDTTKPLVSGAISTSNRSMLVSFSERMGISALDPSNYAIALENVITEAGGLSVISVKFSEDRASVLLQTSSQGSLTYRITVVNAKDLAGNVLANSRSGGGAATDPATAVFAGTAATLLEVVVNTDSNGVTGWQDLNSSGTIDAGDGISNDYGNTQANTFLLVDLDNNGIIDNWQDLDNNGVISSGDRLAGMLDSDLDGLLDNQESTGWNVSILQIDGTSIQREVTSDPYKADTDGDLLSDSEEFSLASDPRNLDTDADNLSDFLEWNIVFSSLVEKDSDADGLPDLDEYKFYSTSPIVADSDGDGISDSDELDDNRNPRIADRPKFSIDVKDVKLFLHETFGYTNEQGESQSVEDVSAVTLSRDTSLSTTAMDSGVSSLMISVEGSIEVNNKGFVPETKKKLTVGGEWSNQSVWQTTKEMTQSSSDVYAESLSKGEELTNTDTYTRNIESGSIQLSVDVLNQGDFTLNFSNIQISVHKKELGALVPIATLSLPDGFGDLQISPLNNSDKGKNLVFSTDDVPANLAEELMRNVPGLIFTVSNYTVVNNEGVTFASTDEAVFNRTAGIVFDYGDMADAERHLVSVAGSNDSAGYVGGGWQGGINSQGHARGISLDYALQDILGMVRHHRYDTIEVGANGVLETQPSSASDDVLVEGNHIKPGENGWIDTAPQGDDVLQSNIVDHRNQPTVLEQGIIAGPDRTATSVALGDDIQEIPIYTEGIPYGTIVVSAGPNKVLDSVVDERDLVEYVGGYETSRTCLGNASTIGAICRSDNDCNTDIEVLGSCQGPERIARINTLRAGDFNRDWFVFQSEDMPTSSDFNNINIKPGQIFRLAFLQDLDRDGLTARTERLNGSIDSAVNVLDNSLFGKNFDFDQALAIGPNGDVFADSRDSDYDGLSDYAEIRVGWTINHPQLGITQVYSHPGLADSDNDGLKDIEEMDLRTYCETDGSEWRMDGLCSFQNDPVVLQQQAVAIIAGRNGIADSMVAGDDDLIVTQWSEGLLYGTAVILPGLNNIIDTPLNGDDQYVTATNNVPSSHPRLKDTDGDNIDDFTELNGFLTVDVIIDGGNALSDTSAAGDDIGLIAIGRDMRANGVLIVPGIDGILDTEVDPVITRYVYGDGDDFFKLIDQVFGPDTLVIDCGPNKVLDTIPLEGDKANGVEFGDSCSRIFHSNIGIFAGPRETSVSTRPNLIEFNNVEKEGADDKVRPAVMVKTDPLRNDSDGDGILDGNEAFVGGNPTLPDPPYFRDTDNDGLIDYIENKGWTVTINGVEIEVKTDPTKADSDGDGLPDLVEKNIGTLPVNEPLKGLSGLDSDGDGLKDFYEFSDFGKYEGYSEIFTGFSLSKDIENIHYGTNPTLADTDSDGLSDFEEVNNNEYKLDPMDSDTDNDGLTDFEEINGWMVKLTTNNFGYMSKPDPNKSDSDQDGLSDKREQQLGTDPRKANTDDDGHNVNDLIETQLGTNPLSPSDRCIKVTVKGVSLIHGLSDSDNSGLVESRISVMLIDRNESIALDETPDVSGYFNEIKLFQGQEPLPYDSLTYLNTEYLLMQDGSSIHTRAEVRYKKGNFFATWSPYKATTKDIALSTFDTATTIEYDLHHIDREISIKNRVHLEALTTRSSVTTCN